MAFQLDPSVFKSAPTVTDYLNQNRKMEMESRANEQAMTMNNEKLRQEKIKQAVIMATPENYGAIREKGIQEGLWDAASVPEQWDDNMMTQLKQAYGNKQGSVSSTLQIANEMAKARAAGDNQRLSDIILSGKLADKGIVYDNEGNALTIPGYGSALGDLMQGKKEGEKRADLGYDPIIEQEKKRMGEIGKAKGEAQASLESQESKIRSLEENVNKLSELGKKATYTYAGRGRDAIIREMGQPVGEGAVARAEYISMVDNQILPLLRDTFGAQFTQKEGESLRATLGDVNKSPEEKDAVLRSFINQKKANIETLRKQVGVEAQPQGGSVVRTQAEYDALPSGSLYTEEDGKTYRKP